MSQTAFGALSQKNPQSAGAKLKPKPAQPPSQIQTSTLPQTTLQRKASCACGGGCPRCESEQQKKPRLQTKLRISTPGDQYEQEADRVAEQVMRMTVSRRESPSIGALQTASHLHRKCAACETEREEDVVRRKEMSGGAARGDTEVETEIDSLRGGGEPLPESVRDFFEPRFGRDLSRVRIDTSARAAQAARSVNARAYTLGNYIAFAQGQYAPATEQGRSLLAHELTHTVQQTSNTTVHRRRLSGVDEEEEAPQTSRAAGAQQLMRAFDGGLAPRQFISHAPSLLLQRQPDDETFEEKADKITERSEEKTFSKTSAGITEQATPGEKFLVMNFAIRESALKKEHQDFLVGTLYSGTLTSDPMAKVTIIGHADSTGDKSFNDLLAKKRAQEVEKFLKDKSFFKPQIDSVKAKGAAEPIADNGTVSGRARNRRVEIIVTPFKPSKPVPELLTDIQKGAKPHVVKMDNFAACPFPDTVKSIVEDAFKALPAVKFDWAGTGPDSDTLISFDDTTTFSTALGLSGDIFLNSFKNNEICRTPGDKTTCEKVFTDTPDVKGRAIANTVAHEIGHSFGLDHVPATDNYMWSPELHPLNSKTNKTFQEKVFLVRQLQSVPENFNDSQLVYMANRIKSPPKKKPGVVTF